jgi:hypothetical protein
VLVRSSYFPNWKASGATGPYRVAPNMMVVVPTSHDVKLTYGLTKVDWLGRLITLFGIAGLIGLVFWKGLERYGATTTRLEDDEPDDDEPEPSDEPLPGGPDGDADEPEDSEPVYS